VKPSAWGLISWTVIPKEHGSPWRSPVIAVNSPIVICDEPVSALDVSIQAHVIRPAETPTAHTEHYLPFHYGQPGAGPAHCESGLLVELAEARATRNALLHPYLEALFSAAPVADPMARKTRIILAGDVPSPMDPPQGCRFHTRCLYRQNICVAEAPALREVAGRRVRCHFVGELIFPQDQVPHPDEGSEAKTWHRPDNARYEKEYAKWKTRFCVKWMRKRTPSLSC
jgi:oligopeptide/dipeptide ABC transporter ATP-binding protein